MATNKTTELIKKRGIIKGSLTRFETFLTNIDRLNPDIVQIKLRIVNINPLFQEFNEIQSEIEMLGEENSEFSENERQIFEDKYFKSLAESETLIVKNDETDWENSGSIKSASVRSNVGIGEVNSEVGGGSVISAVGSVNAAGGGGVIPVVGSGNAVGGNGTDNLNQIRLPRINMPSFEGHYDQWLFFKDTFSSLVHTNDSISSIQKFQYLRLCLKGEARDVIKSLEVSSANYESAWDLLVEQYEDKRLLILNHVKSIFDLPSSTRESHEHLRKLTNDLNKHMKALEVLGQPVKYWDTLIIYVILQKLDKVTRREFESKFSEELPTMQNFYAFLRKESKFLGNLDANVTVCNKMKSKGNNFFASTSNECFNCNGKHLMYQCEEFLKLPVDKRWERVKQIGVCFNCFRKNHSTYECKMRGCMKCRKRHNTALHNLYGVNKDHNNIRKNSSIEQIQVVANNTAGEENAIAGTTTTLCNSFNGFTQVLLSTAIINVYDNEENTHPARVLIDSGSQSHFVTNELVHKLKLPVSKINFSVSGLNQSLTKISNKVNIRFSSKHSNFEGNLNCLIVPKIADHMPSAPIDKTSLNLPEYIKLADNTFNQVERIDMLIGADLFWSLVRPGQYHLGKNRPIMQETVLGWVISGPISAQRATSRKFCGFVSDEIINSNLIRFWETEHCPESKPLSPEEEFCEKHFAYTTKRMPDGRFVVKYPLKNSAEILGDSKQIALKRFEQLERRLNKNVSLKLEYAKFIREYEELGHSTRLTDENDYMSCYLCHHCVIKQESLSTKLRVVFDASTKTTSGYSLNDIQATGPVIQQDLFSIVTRFRKHNYVLTADITKMYRQVLISEEQRPLQRILWRDSITGEIIRYQLNTVTYGTTSASFLAVRCLYQLAKENRFKYPRASSIIEDDCYMDDVITGGKSVEEINQIYAEITNILKDGCFVLNKWGSNNSQILKKISDSNKDTIFNIGEGGESKTLGLTWQASRDILKYVINVDKIEKENTKRTVLSVISRLFDPLGLLAPCVIIAKIILQKIWQHNLSWDDFIPQELNVIFERFKKQLPGLNNLEIKRHVICKDPIKIELHGFADASESAYGAAIYIRSIDTKGKVYCNLLCAKGRVAPLKVLTVPRLELCAAFLLSNLVVKVKRILGMEIQEEFLWSDSTITLAWIKTSPHLLKVFCAHRVTEIQTLTSVNNWHFVKTQENPADLLTRGIESKDLIESKLWWHGPKFLLEKSESWSLYNDCNFIPEVDGNELEKETRKNKIILTVTVQTFEIFNKYSKFSKLQRVCAYCLRFKKNAASKVEKRVFGALTADELAESTNCLVKIAQIEMFSKELKLLRKGNQVQSNSKLLNLNPFIDATGVIRVGGRLKNSTFDFEKKHPIIVDAKHNLTILLIKQEHERLLHAGPQAVLASLRDRIWVIAGRNLVRKITRSCVKCFKAKPLSIETLMGHLPLVRVTASRPFLSTGIDFAGPFLLKDRNGRKYNVIKAYVCVFVCLATKAIHLEVVSDLTTDAFMATFHRFVSRRGHCAHVYSDNGTNFVGAQARIERLQSELKERVDFENVQWHFIPPRAPHFGGIWEAGVKSFKTHLKRVLGDTKLNFEEFTTILTQIEACLNSRPLYPLSNDSNDPSPLTPAHFLIGQPLTAVVEPQLCELRINPRKRFIMLQQMKQHFWSRWSKEYVSELQIRMKWKKGHQSLLQLGAVVIVKEDGVPPLKWTLGRIEKLHPGNNGVCRVVSLKTKSGTLKRAVAKVCVLPVPED